MNPNSTARKVMRDSGRWDGDVFIIPPGGRPDHMDRWRDMMDLGNQAEVSTLVINQNYHVRELRRVNYYEVHPS